MRPTRIPIGLFITLLALTSCDGAGPQEPTPQQPFALADLVLEALTPVDATGVVGEYLDVAPAVLVTRDGRPSQGVHIAFTYGPGDPRNAKAMTNAAGKASAGAWRLLPGAGTQTLTASAAGRYLIFKAHAQPGPITSLAVAGGNFQHALVGAPLAAPLRVRATDRYGNVINGAVVTLAVVDGGGSVLPAVVHTGSDGVAESTWTLGANSGTQHVQAEIGEDLVAQFTAEACEPAQCNFQLAYQFEDNIFVVDGPTQVIRQLTSTGTNRDPAWSPDGSRLAFVRDNGGEGWRDIAVMNADGSNVTRVIAPEYYSDPGSSEQYPVWVASPTWSPRGDALAFVSCSNECSLFVQQLSDGGRRLVAAPGFPGGVVFGSSAVWSPDGNRIAFFGFHGLLIGGDDTPFYSLRLANADGSGVTEIVPVTGANMEGATWSPDGTRIAFSMNSDIYVVHADGSGLRRLTTYAFAESPAWSPDGTRIAYARFSSDPEPRIMAIPAAGGEPVMLVAPGTRPSWRP